MTLTEISKDDLRVAILRHAFELAYVADIPTVGIPNYPLIIEKPEVGCAATSNWMFGPIPEDVPPDARDVLYRAADELSKRYRLALPFLGSTAVSLV